MDWTAESISIYQFTRSSIPADIQSGKPDPSTWGQALAVFAGCNMAEKIQNQTIILDTTFCGQWAGQAAVWNSDPVCSKKAATCNDYVQNNPQDFVSSYWQVNSLKVFQNDAGFIGSSPISPSASTSASVPASTPSTSSRSIPTTLSTFATSAPSVGALPTSVQIVTLSMTTTTTASANAAAEQATSPLPTVRPPGDCTGHPEGGCISMKSADPHRSNNQKQTHHQAQA